MKRLQGKAREHCSLGHKLELPIITSFFQDYEEGEDGIFDSSEYKFASASVYTCGLVGKKELHMPKIALILFYFYQ